MSEIIFISQWTITVDKRTFLGLFVQGQTKSILLPVYDFYTKAVQKNLKIHRFGVCCNSSVVHMLYRDIHTDIGSVTQFVIQIKGFKMVIIGYAVEETL